MPKKGAKATPAQLAALELGRAKPGEARRRPVDELLPDEAAIREEIIRDLPPGERSQRELALAALIAPVKVQENRAHAWMAANRRNPSANAWRKIELASRCSKLLADLYGQLHDASEERLQRQRLPNAGQPVQPSRDPTHQARTLALLLKQGAVTAPGLKRETQALLSEAGAAALRDLDDHKATVAELGAANE